MSQKIQFVEDHRSGVFTMSELCERNDITRKTGYATLKRFEELGEAGLKERSRRPHSSPNKTPEYIEQRILEMRRAKPTWGAGMILEHLRTKHPELRSFLPARSTAHEILRRNGCTKNRRPRRSKPPATRQTTEPTAPNTVWTADFKGDFLTGDGKRIYPLTIADSFSRFLLAVQGLPSPTIKGSWKVFERAFREYGLPEVMLTDNGTPFASAGLARLSRLNVWWIKLGIKVERIEPGKPTQNARHERMHRTLKKSCARPPAKTQRAQQHRFTHFVHEYNYERPHQALDYRVPADYYCHSPRPMPDKTPEVHYPGHYEKRKVSASGSIRWRTHTIFLTHALELEWVGMHEFDDGWWSIEFAGIELGRFDVRNAKLHTGGLLGPAASTKKHGRRNNKIEE